MFFDAAVTGGEQCRLPALQDRGRCCVTDRGVGTVSSSSCSMTSEPVFLMKVDMSLEFPNPCLVIVRGRPVTGFSQSDYSDMLRKRKRRGLPIANCRLPIVRYAIHV